MIQIMSCQESRMSSIMLILSHRWQMLHLYRFDKGFGMSCIWYSYSLVHVIKGLWTVNTSFQPKSCCLFTNTGWVTFTSCWYIVHCFVMTFQTIGKLSQTSTLKKTTRMQKKTHYDQTTDSFLVHSIYGWTLCHYEYFLI